MPMNIQQRLQGGLAVGGLQVGDGTGIKALTIFYAPITVTNVAANATATSTVNAEGVKAGDIVIGFQPPTVAGHLKPITARVSADDTIEVTWVNPTAGQLSFNSGVATAAFVVARTFT
ncbi:hypothetical protein [Azospirillum argentinense]|uniref:Uncharacterized protein n=1 Tax=Azospirillum brasilense TaxID=192 RepID=A0A4D8QEP7_AZOBR|nr:hypothetical protein [Azospirillum argentinense]QCO07396.1 hypothetical protein D3867_36600 [Azospirillum argentinense]